MLEGIFFGSLVKEVMMNDITLMNCIMLSLVKNYV